MDIPRAIVMAASGHKPINVHEGYINFCDEQLTNGFAELMLPPAKRPRHFRHEAQRAGSFKMARGDPLFIAEKSLDSHFYGCGYSIGHLNGFGNEA